MSNGGFFIDRVRPRLAPICMGMASRVWLPRHHWSGHHDGQPLRISLLVVRSFMWILYDALVSLAPA
jgi:hypothetical protein